MPARTLLFYTHSLAPGGGERVWALLAGALRRRGHRIVFAQDYVTPPPRAPLDGGVPLRTLGPGHGRSIRALARLIDEARPDVALSAVGGSNIKLWAAMRLARHRPRAIHSFHGFEEYKTGWMALATYLAIPLTSRTTDRTVAVSEGLKQALIGRWRADAGRMRRIHNPVQVPDPLPSIGAADLARRAPVVLAVGRLSAEKDFATLVRAAGRLRTPDVRVEILGAGPERAALESQIAAAGLGGRVRLLGYADDPWPHYARARCLAVPSRTEAFGNVVVEGLAAGLPVVAMQCAGPAEILDGGRLGALVPVGDDAALAGKLDAALADPGDPAPRQARARDFSLATGCDAYEALIEEVLADASGHAGPSSGMA